MNLLGLVIPWWGRVLAVLAVLAAAAAFGAAKMHAYDQDRYDALEAKFEAFKDQVTAAGVLARQQAKAKEDADKKRKDAADAENSAALATLAGLLHNARSRPVSAPAACPSSPDGAARFRAESERAYRDLVEGLRGEGERCSKAVIGLNTGKRWAQGK